MNYLCICIIRLITKQWNLCFFLPNGGEDPKMDGTGWVIAPRKNILRGGIAFIAGSWVFPGTLLICGSWTISI